MLIPHRKRIHCGHIRSAYRAYYWWVRATVYIHLAASNWNSIKRLVAIYIYIYINYIGLSSGCLIRTAPENHLLGGKHQMYRVGLCKSHFVFISEDLFKLHILSKCKACIFLHLPSPKKLCMQKTNSGIYGRGGRLKARVGVALATDCINWLIKELEKKPFRVYFALGSDTWLRFPLPAVIVCFLFHFSVICCANEISAL